MGTSVSPWPEASSSTPGAGGTTREELSLHPNIRRTPEKSSRACTRSSGLCWQGLATVPFSAHYNRPLFQLNLSMKLSLHHHVLNMPTQRCLNSMSGLITKVWYRMPFDQSELSISKIPPTDSPTVRPGRHP